MGIKGRILNREILKLMRKPQSTQIDPGIRIAINNLQNQINLLQKKFLDNSNSDSYGNPGMEAPDIAVIAMQNKSGAGRNLGEVVVLSAANENAFTITSTANDENVIGVVASDSPDGTADAVEIDAVGCVCIAGKTPVKVVSPVSVGDKLKAHSTAGYAARAQVGNEPGIFAIAAEELLTGSGLIESIIELNNRFGNFPVSQPFDFRVSHDTDGSITGFSGYVASASFWRTSDLSAYIEHDIYNYNLSGLLCSTTLSTFSVGGVGLNTFRQVVTYSVGRMERIIQELI